MMLIKYCKNLLVCILVGASVGTISEVAISSISENTLSEAKVYCNENNHYVLNKNSKKIHIDNCSAEDKMNDKNRINVEDSIVNLVNKGYVVCANCKAGIKYNIEKIGDIIDDINIENYDVGELPSKEEYLESIEKTGEWYVNHIATYQSNISTEDIKTDFPNGSNVKKYNIHIKTYRTAIKDDEKKEKDVLTFLTNGKITRAKRSAIDNYIDTYYKLVFKPNWFIRKTTYYEWEDLKNTLDDYDMAGDDCVRFMFSYMDRIKPDFTYHLAKIIGEKWSKINTNKLIKEDKKVFDAMYKLGFEIYDAKKINALTDNYTIKQIDDNFTLQKGDIMLRKGHLHVYLGDGNVGDGEDNFGWGRVYREYPRRYEFEKKKDENGYYFIIKEENDINKKYTRIYRYVGNNQ